MGILLFLGILFIFAFKAALCTGYFGFSQSINAGRFFIYLLLCLTFPSIGSINGRLKFSLLLLIFPFNG